MYLNSLGHRFNKTSQERKIRGIKLVDLKILSIPGLDPRGVELQTHQADEKLLEVSSTYLISSDLLG